MRGGGAADHASLLVTKELRLGQQLAARQDAFHQFGTKPHQVQQLQLIVARGQARIRGVGDAIQGLMQQLE